MSVKGAKEKIHAAITSWPGVTAHPHRFGGTEYRLGKRELGHVHGDGLVDIPFPKKVRDQVVAAGRAEPHHILPESGWISFYLHDSTDVERAIALFRQAFDLATKRWSREFS
jgi:Luciferase